MTILDDAIEVDFAGTSGLSQRGINVPAPRIRRAYSVFGIKVVVAPEIPEQLGEPASRSACRFRKAAS